MSINLSSPFTFKVHLSRISLLGYNLKCVYRKGVLLSVLTCFAIVNSIQAQTNEIKIKEMLKTFHSAVRANKDEQLSNLINFPLPTNVSSQDLENGKPNEPISKQEFKKYAQAIFNKKVIELIIKSNSDDLTEVNSLSGTYYSTLQKNTDKRSQMYELYFQYPEDHSKAESYFSFVFGQVLGNYKIIGYYAKWPIK